MKGLRPGRIVDVVNKRTHRHEPGLVVDVHPVTEQVADGTIDADVHGMDGMRRARAVPYSEECKPGTWHWLEVAE